MCAPPTRCTSSDIRRSPALSALSMQQLASAGVPADDLHLVFVGDPAAPDGGIYSEFGWTDFAPGTDAPDPRQPVSDRCLHPRIRHGGGLAPIPVRSQRGCDAAAPFAAVHGTPETLGVQFQRSEKAARVGEADVDGSDRRAEPVTSTRNLRRLDGTSEPELDDAVT